MGDQKCQLCGYEIKEHTEVCSNCSWPITKYPSNLPESSEVLKREQQMFISAKKIFDEYKRKHLELQTLQQQLDKYKNQNVSLANSSLIEKYLQNLCSTEEAQLNLIKDLSTSIKQINERLSNDKLNVIVHPPYSDTIITSPEIQNKNNGDNFQTIPNAEAGNYYISTEEEFTDNNGLLNAEISPCNDNPEALHLVKDYNQLKDFDYKIEVSETAESKSQRRDSSQSLPIFEVKVRGDYWVINQKYLVPRRKRFDTYSYETLSTLFECRKYNQSFSGNFILIKPGKVNSLNNQEIWQLEERGIIEFL
ncbi:hypothetical protein [Cuspidothrix issatschenkoi]|uniref:Uncharacterized protein n=1 Tax=Cuspidothrix issatschenkoi CHARLIE-1 TaxID=2052836 RepID=A0A2S6CT43_9CYAN|nr:hypothetical protein [Cuspidothrix issatschenkoi]PPJ62906.1 hypothetical protein CUN59_12970 [Cuspidothrix issatschenkoi CHARLIE-1]